MQLFFLSHTLFNSFFGCNNTYTHTKHSVTHAFLQNWMQRLIQAKKKRNERRKKKRCSCRNVILLYIQCLCCHSLWLTKHRRLFWSQNILRIHRCCFYRSLFVFVFRMSVCSFFFSFFRYRRLCCTGFWRLLSVSLLLLCSSLLLLAHRPPPTLFSVIHSHSSSLPHISTRIFLIHSLRLLFILLSFFGSCSVVDPTHG